MDIITIIDKKNNVYKTIYDKTDRNVYDLLDGLIGIKNFIYDKNVRFITEHIYFSTVFILK